MSPKQFEQRPLDGMEQLFASFHRATGDLVVVGVALVEALSVAPSQGDKIQKAIEQLYSQNAILQTKIEERGELEADYLSLGASCPRLRVTNQSWQGCLSEEINSPLPESGPLWRFTICHDGGKGYLLISAHHSVCDGISLVTVLKELLLLAATGNPERLPKRPGLEAPIDMVQKVWPKKGDRNSNLPQPDYSKAVPTIDNPLVPLSQRKAQLLFHRFSTEEVEIMVQACRKHKVTLQPLLSAAFTWSISATGMITVPTYSLNQMLPINVRRYLHDEKAQELGNLFACPELSTRFNNCWNQTQWWAEIQRLYAGLEQMLASREYLWMLDTPAPQMKSSVARLFERCSLEAYHGRDYPSGVSNLGQVDLKTGYAMWDAQEVYFSSGHGKMGTYLFISIVTIADGMGLCLDYPYPLCSTYRAREFFGNFCHFLTEMTQARVRPR